jgi:recombination protein RecA
MAAAHDVEALLSQLGAKLRFAKESEGPRALPLDWPELESVLPDGGAAVQAGQARAPGAWCAWIDPEGTLHAPGVVAAGVDLARMLVVRAPRAQVARAAVKVVASGAFEVVVVDLDAVRGGEGSAPRADVDGTSPALPERGLHLMARKLALAAEPSGATVLLLTDSTRPRAAPWPVALRLELSRPDARTLSVRVAKDRRGRVGLARAVPFRPLTRLAG